VAIRTEYERRRDRIPIPTEFRWHPVKPQFTISSKWLSFLVHFTPEQLVVHAELSMTAKVFATKENREHAVRIIEAIADDLGL
jgi:hypothetical protein